MRSINSILQGNEQTLFIRVLRYLQFANCEGKILREFEKHKSDSLEDLLDASKKYLKLVGYW